MTPRDDLPMSRLRRAEATIRALTQRLDMLELRVPPPAEPVPAGMAEIVAAVSAQFGVAVAHMRGPSRCARYIPARFEAYRRLHDVGYSYPQIGRYFERDHTTIRSGAAKAGKSEAPPV